MFKVDDFITLQNGATVLFDFMSYALLQGFRQGSLRMCAEV